VLLDKFIVKMIHSYEQRQDNRATDIKISTSMIT